MTHTRDSKKNHAGGQEVWRASIEGRFETTVPVSALIPTSISESDLRHRLEMSSSGGLPVFMIAVSKDGNVMLNYESNAHSRGGNDVADRKPAIGHAICVLIGGNFSSADWMDARLKAACEMLPSFPSNESLDNSLIASVSNLPELFARHADGSVRPIPKYIIGHPNPGYIEAKDTSLGDMVLALSRLEMKCVDLPTAEGRKYFRIELEDDTEQHSDPEKHPAVAKAIKAAYARGSMVAAEILNGSEMLSTAEMSDRMGMSRQAVHKALATDRLLAIKGAKRGFRFPEWQIDEIGRQRTGLIETLALVGNGWPALRFFRAKTAGYTNQHRLTQGNVQHLLHEAELWLGQDYG